MKYCGSFLSFDVYRQYRNVKTRHFYFVCQGDTLAIKDLTILFDIPVIFCVLTDNTMGQAVARSGGEHGNKGTEAAVAAIKMAALRHL